MSCSSYPPFPNCRSYLLYADDTLLFLNPTRTQMLKTKLIFDIFAKLSGLSINLLKSQLSTTSSPLSLGQTLAATIQCTHAAFPIRYLGLPLSDKSLKKSDFSPLIDRFQHTLAGWKAALLSVGGRIILTNAVLFAIPQYFMSMFRLPKWVIQRIDQIRRRFLWHGHKDPLGQKKGLYMVNWQLATKPRCIGGLGIRDIQIANQALLMKWLWLWFQLQNNWWKQATIMSNDCHRPWEDAHASTFWKNLSSLAPAFQCSITHVNGQENTIRFWHDNWCGKAFKYAFPRLFLAALQPDSYVQQNRNLLVWAPQFGHLDPSAQAEKETLLLSLQNAPAAQNLDEVIWSRKPPTFSVGSAYSFLAHTPSPQPTLLPIWKIKAPLRVLVFAWLLLTNRLTTLENLSRRGWHLPSICTMCRQSEETTHHLFYACTLAKEIRDYIYVAFVMQHNIPLIYKSEHSACLLTEPGISPQSGQWEIATCFVLWREHCRRTFSTTS